MTDRQTDRWSANLRCGGKRGTTGDRNTDSGKSPVPLAQVKNAQSPKGYKGNLGSGALRVGSEDKESLPGDAGAAVFSVGLR